MWRTWRPRSTRRLTGKINPLVYVIDGELMLVQTRGVSAAGLTDAIRKSFAA